MSTHSPATRTTLSLGADRPCSGVRERAAGQASEKAARQRKQHGNDAARQRKLLTAQSVDSDANASPSCLVMRAA
jgi:hypothetical protein